MSIKLTDAHALTAISEAHGYLRHSGWIDSYIARLPIDAQFKPIPWYTYAAIEFLKPKITKQMSVYEFGSGHSTLWYAAKAGKVAAVEHNEKWHEIIKAKIPANVIYECNPDGEEYAAEILTHGRIFDVVVIDGVERNKCTVNAVKCLKSDGVIIFDNSTDSAYLEAYMYLEKYGFKRIDFHGLTPICTVTNCTSIFYRQPNCMGI